jgi:hypothetical protein
MSTQGHEFDKGIDIPATSARTGVNVDLLRAMPVGTSKWFSPKEVKKATRFYRVAKKLGMTILIRKVTKEDPRGAGVRMWRTEGRVALDPIAAAEKKATKRSAPKAKAKAKPKAKKKAAKPKRAASKKRKTNSAAAPTAQ